MRTTTMRHIGQCLLSGALLLSLASCINDNYIEDLAYTDGKVAVEMSIQTRSLSNSITSTSETYVPGTEWENYVDFNGGDYRIYFFTYDTSEQTTGGTNSTLIAEFTPKEIFSTDLDTYTRYTLSGEVDEDLIESLTNFKVVVVANWGKDNYPTESDIADEFTIDKLCSYEKAVFSAFVDNDQKATMPSASNLIPFFGLREYSGVTWKDGTMTRLSGDITLLRSVAKVEVILEPTEDQLEQELTFDDVSIVNYNAQGYCAPTGVYLKEDYDHDGEWADDFVDGLHLVSTDTEGKGVNDPDQTNRTISMYKTTNSEGKETWTCYLTEYDNTSNDAVYSYISVLADFQLPDDEPYKIYFANYDNGSTTAYGDDEDTDKSDRYNIYRNYLYRYHVTLKNRELRVFVETWENVFDNEWTFGVTEPEAVGEDFTVNGIMYEVLTSTVVDEDNVGEPSETLTVKTTRGGTFDDVVVIPETVRHNGFTYTVTEIGDETFNGQITITSITIPETVTSIGSEAFEDCASLVSLTIENYSPPTCAANAFQDDTISSITLYVPYQVVETYKADETWGTLDFKSIEGIPGTEPD